MTSAHADWTGRLTGQVRANRAYHLRSLASLPERYRGSLERAGVDTAAVFGVLVAHPGTGLPDKVVDEAAARVFAALEQTGRPPKEIHGRLAELVLDSVLEIEGRAGFVTGPLAYDAFHQERASDVPDNRLRALSRAALEYAERLGLGSADNVTARLYAYHRVPWSPRWARAYPGPGAVLDMLPERPLARRWVASERQPSHWLCWSSAESAGEVRSTNLPYKLYISPRTEELPDVLPPLIDALTASSAPRFKIGADVAGLLRPDKIVVYLRDAAETERVACAVNAAVGGASPHGVPFSAELAGDGLLSWGGDPPPDAAPIGRRAESWRLSVCRRLAESLVAAQRAPLRRTRPTDFALARLVLGGVDVRSFAPAGLVPPSLTAADQLVPAG